jgi:hypothetical protein
MGCSRARPISGGGSRQSSEGRAPHVPSATFVLVWAGSIRDCDMPPTPLRKLYRSLGKNIQDDKTACKTLLHDPAVLARMFRESVVDGGRKRRRGDRVAAVQNGGAQPCRSLGGEDRGDSPDHTPFQREAQECTATWRCGARYAVRC